MIEGLNKPESNDISESQPKYNADYIDSSSYTEQHPDMLEFKKPWEAGCVQVGQGNGGISKEGKPIESEGMSLCAVLILQNSSTNEAALFHVDEWGLNCDQQRVLESLSRGSFVARWVRGTLSRDIGDLNKNKYFNSRVNVDRFMSDVVVDTGNLHWAIVYDPVKKLIYVMSKKQKKVLTFNFD